MKAVINRILENNLSELKGLSVEGEIPVTEEFLNELLRLYLENISTGSATPVQSPASASSGIDFLQILDSLDRKELKIELKENIAVIKVSAKKF